MDAHQPAEPNIPVWYIGHHLPTPNVGISIGTLEEEISNGVNLPEKKIILHMGWHISNYYVSILV